MNSNTITLLTGDSGMGKSSLVRTAAEYCWNVHHKRLRLYTADGGGFPTMVEAAIGSGIIEVWRLRSRIGAGGEGLIEETLARAAQGYWPEILDQDGFCPEGARLLPPIEVVHILSCPNGHQVRSGARRDASAVMCPSCKTMVDQRNARWSVSSQRLMPEDVGAVAFEGLPSWQQWFLEAYANRRAGGEITSGEKSGVPSIQSGQYRIGGNTRPDIYAAQTEANKWLMSSTAIPGLVLPAIWTGLEQKIGDLGESLGQWAPKIAGFAQSAEVPQWVGNWIGLHSVPDNGVYRRRLYLSEFRGTDGVPHKYKCRAEGLPAYLEDDACPRCVKGEPCGLDSPHFEKMSLGEVFRLLDEARERALAKSKERIKDAPGPRVAAPKPVVIQPGPVSPVVKVGPVAQPLVASKPSATPRPIIAAPRVGAKRP